MKKLLVMLVGLMLVTDEGVWCACSADPTESTARSTTAAAGDPAKKVTARGTLEPEEVVDVSAQVAGRIMSLGIDPRIRVKTIDYGSVVQAGTVLAQVDSAEYALAVEHSQAGCRLGEAELVQEQAKLELAEARWQVAKTKGSIPGSDVVTAKSNYKVAKAAVAAAEAALAQKKAVLKEAQLKLSYTTIKSPIAGVVIDRRVNVGQMTSVGPNAPSLFLIAKDLRRIQVWASVDEADIGRIHVGTPVRFTVDACPGKTFRGKVDQIRLNATMTQNVVTYTVVIATDNPDGRVLPYLTAKVQFE